jgi:hypothetical protein
MTARISWWKKRRALVTWYYNTSISLLPRFRHVKGNWFNYTWLTVTEFNTWSLKMVIKSSGTYKSYNVVFNLPIVINMTRNVCILLYISIDLCVHSYWGCVITDYNSINDWILFSASVLFSFLKRQELCPWGERDICVIFIILFLNKL